MDLRDQLLVVGIVALGVFMLLGAAIAHDYFVRDCASRGGVWINATCLDPKALR